MSAEGVNYYIGKIANLPWGKKEPEAVLQNLRDTAAVLNLAWDGIIGIRQRRVVLGGVTVRMTAPKVTDEEYNQRLVGEVYKFLRKRKIDPGELERLRDDDGENFGYMIPEELEVRQKV